MDTFDMINLQLTLGDDLKDPGVKLNEVNQMVSRWRLENQERSTASLANGMIALRQQVGVLSEAVSRSQSAPSSISEVGASGDSKRRIKKQAVKNRLNK